MKKGMMIALSLCLVFLLCFFAIPAQKKNAHGYLRIHIRANSNQIYDQQVKIKVKDEIVAYLTPLLTDAQTAKQAMQKVNEHLPSLSALASEVLLQSGFVYKAKAKLKNEYFPTRCYDETVLENGYYDALIVELGDAEGDNWWCVVYPPLCFVGSENPNGNVVYKSKLYEIIKAWKKGR